MRKRSTIYYSWATLNCLLKPKEVLDLYFIHAEREGYNHLEHSLAKWLRDLEIRRG